MKMKYTVAYDGEEYEGGVDIAKELVYVKKTGSPPGRAAVSYEQLEKLGGGFHHLYGAARLILEEHRAEVKMKYAQTDRSGTRIYL